MAETTAQTPETATTQQQPAPGATPTTQVAEPTKHQHTQRLLGIANEVGIGHEQAELMDDAALRREIADAQLEHQVRQSRRPQVQPQTQPRTEPVQEEDDAIVLPAALKEKLASLDPAVGEAVEFIGQQASAKIKRSREGVKRLEANQQVGSLQAQVAQVLDQLPATGGSRDARLRAVWSELNALASAGEATGNVAQDVRRAYANVYGTAAPAPATPKPAPVVKKTPTPTAVPTHRLSNDLQSQLDHLNGNTDEDFAP